MPLNTSCKVGGKKRLASTDALDDTQSDGADAAGMSNLRIPFACGGCKEPCDMEDSKQRGSNVMNRWHPECITAWRSYLDRMKTTPSLKTDWQEKTPAGKAAWFVEQRSHTKGRKRQFDTAKVRQTESETSGHKRRRLVYLQPKTEWCKDVQILRGGKFSIDELDHKWEAEVTPFL